MNTFLFVPYNIMSLRSIALDYPSQQGGYIGDGATFNTLTGNNLTVDNITVLNTISAPTISTGTDTQPTNMLYGTIAISTDASSPFIRVNLQQPFYYNIATPTDPLNPSILATMAYGLRAGTSAPPPVSATYSAGFLNVYPGCSGTIGTLANNTYVDILWIGNPYPAVAPGAAPSAPGAVAVSGGRISWFITGSPPATAPSRWGGILGQMPPGGGAKWNGWSVYTGAVTPGGIPQFTGLTRTPATGGVAGKAFYNFSTFVPGAGGSYDINGWLSDSGTLAPPTIGSTTKFYMPYSITPVKGAGAVSSFPTSQQNPNQFTTYTGAGNFILPSLRQTTPPAIPVGTFPGFWIQGVLIRNNATNRVQDITNRMISTASSPTSPVTQQQPSATGYGIRFQVYGREETNTSGGFWIDWEIGTTFPNQDNTDVDISTPGSPYSVFVVLGCCGTNGTANTIAWSQNTQQTGTTNEIYSGSTLPSSVTFQLPTPPPAP
jgi:hypothetical protein